MIYRVASISFWLVAFLLSFTFLPAYQSEMVVGAIGLILVAVLMRGFSGLYSGSWSFPKEASLAVFGVFWMVALGSVFWSQIPWISVPQFWVFSCFPLSVLFFLSGQRELAIKGVLVVLSLFSVFAFCQYYIVPDMLYDGRVAWPLKNPNSLGAVFSMGAFLALGFGLKGVMRKEQSQWAWCCFVLMVVGLIMTGSRGAFGAFILGVGFLFFVVRPKVCWKKAGMLLVGLGVVAFAVTLSGARPDNMALVSSAKTAVGDYPLLWTRAELWASTWEMIKSAPILGTGIGTFSQFYEQYRDPAERTAGFMAHNDPLQFWAEMGVLSFVLFYGFAVLMCMRTWRAFKCGFVVLRGRTLCLSAPRF